MMNFPVNRKFLPPPNLSLKLSDNIGVMTSQKSRLNNEFLLRERVVPLLSDAVDALEIEPPAPHIALKRLKAVLSIIGGAKQ